MKTRHYSTRNAQKKRMFDKLRAPQTTPKLGKRLDGKARPPSTMLLCDKTNTLLTHLATDLIVIPVGKVRQPQERSWSHRLVSLALFHPLALRTREHTVGRRGAEKEGG